MIKEAPNSDGRSKALSRDQALPQWFSTGWSALLAFVSTFGHAHPSHWNVGL